MDQARRSVVADLLSEAQVKASDQLVEAVLDVVRHIPAGHVLTYGDVAWEVGLPGRARWVGQVLARSGELEPDERLPWWRVVRASGAPAAVALQEALARLLAEGCPLTPDRSRVDLRRARPPHRSPP